MSHLKKIIWGVEAFSEDKSLQNKTAHALKAILSHTLAQVDPVYVLSPDQLRLPVEVFSDSVEAPHYNFDNFADHAREVAGVIEKELQDWLGGLNLPRMTTPRLLIQEEFSLRASVSSLIRFAKSEQADWIAVSTHARHGMARFLLGSFAETLVHASELPVLVVGPDSVEMSDVRFLIFPTDFTPASRRTFEKAVGLAQELKVELILFHKVVYLTRYLSAFRQDAEDIDHQMRNTGLRKEEAERWAEWGREQGATVSVAIEDLVTADVASAILARAHETPSSLVVMASQTGPVESAMLGSVTRKIVRHASCPVLVLHP